MQLQTARLGGGSPVSARPDDPVGRGVRGRRGLWLKNKFRWLFGKADVVVVYLRPVLKKTPLEG